MTMTREDAINILRKLKESGLYFSQRLAIDTAIAALEQPEFVRCLRCAGCRYYADGHCDMHHMATDPDDFCSYAVGR